MSDAEPRLEDPDVEIVAHARFDAVITEALDSPTALEGALFQLTEWLTDLDVQPGDELVLVRRRVPEGG